MASDPRIPANTLGGTSPPPPAVPANRSTPATTNADGLTELANSINVCLRDIADKMKHGILRAMDAGDLLNKAKTRIGHGNWAAWLKENCELSERTAQRYMLLAEHRPMIESKSATLADFTIRQAEKLISGPRPSNGQLNTASSPSREVPKLIGGNDPVDAVRAAQDKLLAALKTLRRNDERKAKEAASAIVRRLEEVDLYVVA